jgi:hypothetical protein
MFGPSTISLRVDIYISEYRPNIGRWTETGIASVDAEAMLGWHRIGRCFIGIAARLQVEL